MPVFFSPAPTTVTSPLPAFDQLYCMALRGSPVRPVADAPPCVVAIGFAVRAVRSAAPVMLPESTLGAANSGLAGLLIIASVSGVPPAATDSPVIGTTRTVVPSGYTTAPALVRNWSL